MIKEIDHGHYQGSTLFCTAYAFTHLIESVAKEMYPEYSPHVSPLKVVWRGLRGMGFNRFLNRSMSVLDIQKGVTKTTPINVGLRRPGHSKKILTIESFKVIYETEPTAERLRYLLEKGMLVVTYKKVHAMAVVDTNGKGFRIYDPANRKEKRINVPEDWAKGVTEVYCILLNIKEA